MLSESYFSFAPCTTFATNAFNIRDNYCRLQKNVVPLHSEIRRDTASPPALSRREGAGELKAHKENLSIKPAKVTK